MTTPIRMFEVSIPNWSGYICIRAFDEHDAIELARILFKISTDTVMTAVPHVIA